MRRSVLNFVGAIILLLGIAGSGFIYWHEQPRRGPDSGAMDEDSPLSSEDSRRYARNEEIYSGKLGLLMNKWTQAIASLAEPGPLAIIVALSSTGIAVICFTMASRSSTPGQRPAS